MGYYENQYFRPALSQYEVIEKKNQAASKGFLNWRGTVVGERLLANKKLVYTGMDLISVDSLNSSTSEFFVNFYIWFRFKGNFNERQIVFENAATPILLGQPLLETRQDDFTIRAYEVRVKFKQTMAYDDFPFEKQHLNIRFHHKLQTDHKLIFIPDYLSMRTLTSLKEKQEGIDKPSDWMVNHVTQVRDTFERQFKGFKLSYSRYNLQIQIERTDRLFPLKFLFPLLILVLFLYLSLFLPVGHVWMRLSILLPVELVTGIYHYYLKSLNQTGSLMGFEINFYAVYALGILCLAVILKGIFFPKGNDIKWDALFNRGCVGIYSFVITLFR
jgi:branched-chain amino acid transport system substrate-binding protein